MNTLPISNEHRLRHVKIGYATLAQYRLVRRHPQKLILNMQTHFLESSHGSCNEWPIPQVQAKGFFAANGRADTFKRKHLIMVTGVIE